MTTYGPAIFQEAAFSGQFRSKLIIFKLVKISIVLPTCNIRPN